MTDDVELLRGYIENGSEGAFAELVRRHVDFVYSTALRMTRGTHRAEDVTQTVFVDLCRKAKKLAGRQDLVGWLYISTRYASAALVRTESRRERRESDWVEPQETKSEEPGTIDWEQLAPFLDSVLGKLPSCDRDAILLRFFKDASFAEIGSALRVSENAARMRVDRAVERARQLLTRRGIVTTSAAIEAALAGCPAVAAPVSVVNAVLGTAMTAAVSGAGGAASSVLALMNVTKLATGALALGAIVGVGILEKTISKTQAEIASANSDVSLVGRHIAELAKQPGAAAVRRAQVAAKIASPVALGPDWKALVKNPALEAAYLSSYRAALPTEYAALYEQLHFTQAQIHQFEQAVLNREQADLDAAFSGLSMGLPIDDPAIKTLIEKDQAEQTEELQGLVTAQQLSDYNKSQFGRSISTQLAAALRYTDTPLTSVQSAAIADLLAANAGDQNHQADWASVMAKAPGLLSDSQLIQLEALRDGMQARQQLEVAQVSAASAANAGSK